MSGRKNRMRFRYPDWVPAVMLVYVLLALALLLGARAWDWVGGFWR